MKNAICRCFEENGTERQKDMCNAAGEKARVTHDGDANYRRLLEIYESIAGQER